MSRKPYNTDLAFIHDTGFGQLAASAATELLARLRAGGWNQGLVIDLGCGSGILARAVSDAGFAVLGYDISAAMIALAKSRVPAGDFRESSFLDAPLPACIAVTAVGEVFNYLFDERNSHSRLRLLYRRIHKALEPGGLFLFDVATPGRIPGGVVRSWREADDWACLYAVEEDSRRRVASRRITSFRKVGDLYRRDSEVHRQRLYDSKRTAAMLRETGFRVRALRHYGSLHLPPGCIAFAARKPLPSS